jgi:hypothetical protein
MHLHQYFIDKEIQSFWLAAQKKRDCPDGSHAIQRKDGFTQNTHSYQVQQIPDSEENEGGPKVEHKKLKD